MATISVSYALSSLVAVATVTSVTASTDYSTYSYETDGASVSYSYEIIDTRPLPAENVFPSDSDTKTVGINPDDDVTMSESDEKEVNISPTDSVTAQESLFKVVTNPIDFDPSDDDVDPTPVTMADSDAKEVTIGELADNDETSVAETSAKTATKPGITASVATSEAINQFRPVKNVTDTTTTSEAIDRFDVTTELDDTVTVTETSAKTITPAGKTDSVEMLGSNIKTFNSSVDFDPSDDDVDPDPINTSDTINSFDVDKGLTDSASMAESSAKNFTRPDVADTATASDAPALNPELAKSDSVTAVEGIKNNPDLAKSDTTTVSETINKFDVRPSFTDSISTPTEAIDAFTVNLAKSDSVTVTEVSVKNFTENVDFDRSDADADADPVSMTESLAANPSKPLSDTVAPSEAKVFSITTAYTDTFSIIESIVTNLILGESEKLYPSSVYMSSGRESPYLRGYHRGLNETSGVVSRVADSFLMNENYLNEKVMSGDIYTSDPAEDREFTQDQYRWRYADTTGVLGLGDSLLNSAPIWEVTDDDIARSEYVGIIGSAGLVNTAIMNADTITYGVLTNAGLVVNFMYTDTEDTSLGGHYLNETPLSAGAYS